MGWPDIDCSGAGCAGCDVNDGCSGNTRLAGTVHTVVTINYQGQGHGAMGPLLAGEGVALRVGRVCVVRAIGRSIIGEVLQAVTPRWLDVCVIVNGPLFYFLIETSGQSGVQVRQLGQCSSERGLEVQKGWWHRETLCVCVMFPRLGWA